MEFSVRVDAFRSVPPYRAAASIGALVGLMLGVWFLRHNTADVMLLILSGAPILLWLFFKREPMMFGTLLVDEAGFPAWRDEALQGHDVSSTVPVRLVRWHQGPGTVWMRISRQDGWRGDLYVDRSRCEPEEWASLQRWLLWVERG
jgi:hypothetical protein